MEIWIVRINSIEAIRPAEEGTFFNEDWLKRNKLASVNIPDNATDYRYRPYGCIDYVVDGKIHTRRIQRWEEVG